MLRVRFRALRYFVAWVRRYFDVSVVKFVVYYIALVLSAGTLGFHVLEGRDLVDSLYTTVMILTGVGCAQPPSTEAGKLLAVGLIVSGLGALVHVITRVFSALTRGDVLLRLKESDALARIERMRDHVVVLGFGKKGGSVAEELREHGYDVVVVDKDEDKCREALERGFIAVQGDVTEERTLRKAGVEKAQVVVVATNSEETNVFSCILARDMNEDAMILATAYTSTGEKTLRKAGADEVINVYSSAGQSVVCRILDRMSFTVTVRHPLEDTYDEFHIIVSNGGIVVDVRYHIPDLPEPVVKELWIETEEDIRRRMRLHRRSASRRALERLHELSDDVHSHKITVRRIEDRDRIVRELDRAGFLIGVDMSHEEVLREVFGVEAP